MIAVFMYKSYSAKLDYIVLVYKAIYINGYNTQFFIKYDALIHR